MAAELKPAADAGRFEAELVVDRRLWALLMIARTPEVAESILCGLPVMVRNLNAEPLRRGLRGRRRRPDNYISVSHEMLDAVDEAGPIEIERGARR